MRVAQNRFAYDESHLEALLAIRSRTASLESEQRKRIVAVAIEAFKTRSYSEVTVSDIADAAHMAKGNVYRYFDSKEDLLTAAIETLLENTDERFLAAVDALGGPAGVRGKQEKATLMFGYLVADVLPMLLELGARAAKGHEPSADLARKVLRTLAETAGRPFTGSGVAGRRRDRRRLEAHRERVRHGPGMVGRSGLAARPHARRRRPRSLNPDPFLGPARICASRSTLDSGA